MYTNVMKRIGLVLLFLVSLLCVNAQAERIDTYFHTDALGSVVAASDEQGNLLWRKQYEPFGGQLFGGDESEEVSYTGKKYDKATQLNYYGARHYDPSIGKFTSPDPVGVRESIVRNPMMFNRYAYANNNPYRYVDPDGREPTIFAAFRRDTSLKQAQLRGTPFRVLGATLTAAGGASIASIPAAACASSICAGVVSTAATPVLAGEGANNSVNGLKLNKQLGSQQQLGEKGTVFAGKGAKREFRDADRAARDHGGNPDDFVKKRSSAHTAPDGTKFRTHFIENTKTGQQFEHKTKLIDD